MAAASTPVTTKEAAPLSKVDKVVSLADKGKLPGAERLAKGWVRDMLGDSDSDSEADDLKTVELESRPPRLGLGAKYLPHSQVSATMSTVERKLRAMTGAGKQKPQQREAGGGRFGKHNFAVSKASAKESRSDAESEDEEEEEKEVKGSSRFQHGRQQRRIGSADLLTKTSASKGKGSKRKR